MGEKFSGHLGGNVGAGNKAQGLRCWRKEAKHLGPSKAGAGTTCWKVPADPRLQMEGQELSWQLGVCPPNNPRPLPLRGRRHGAGCPCLLIALRAFTRPQPDGKPELASVSTPGGWMWGRWRRHPEAHCLVGARVP